MLNRLFSSWPSVFAGILIFLNSCAMGGISGTTEGSPRSDDSFDDGVEPLNPAPILQCPGVRPDLAARDGWRSSDANGIADDSLRFELEARPTTAKLNGLVAVGAEHIDSFDKMAIAVRFANDGMVDVRDGALYTSGMAYPYEPGVWYSIGISADIQTKTFDVEIGPCGEPRETLIENASFRDDAEVSGQLSTWAVWSSQTAALEVSTPAWMASGDCVPATCESLGQACGQPSDGCGGTLECGGCGNAELCDSGRCVEELVTTPRPPACVPDTCEIVGVECGVRSDGCGAYLACGDCQSGYSCNGGVCVQDLVTPPPPPACEPDTCDRLSRECGVASDGCGGVLSCGSCRSGETCTSGGSCVAAPTLPPACVPHTCQSLGRECGSVSNGCGGTLSCGGCQSGSSCNSGVCVSFTSSTPVAANSVTKTVDGVQFEWEFHCDGAPCEVGTFVDGEPWVYHPNGGVVTITSVSPDGSASGLERNPATGQKAITREQGLLSCAGSDAPYNPSLDLSKQLPISAPADDAVYVNAKRYTGGDCGYTAAVGSCCIDTYATLTVLNRLPEDGGAGTFRPGLAGEQKVWLSIDDLDLSRLPRVPGVPVPSGYSGVVRRWMSPYPDFYTGINGDKGRRWTPHARGLPDYAAQRSESNLKDMFSTFATDPLTAEKREAVYALVRYGLDIYSAYLEGVEWTGGAGQNQGRWHPMIYMGALTTNETIRNNIRAATVNMRTDSDGGDLQFTDLYQVRPSHNGSAIWGSAPGADGCSQGGFGGHGRYWSDYTRKLLRGETSKAKGTCGDPYGYIDGPAEDVGTHYASCCSSGTYISIALAMKIWPEFKYVANNPAMLSFAERVMDGAGWSVKDDQCTVFDPREPTTCAPYTESMANSTCNYFGVTWGYKNGTCITITEAAGMGHPAPGPRWSPAERHLKGRPTLDRGNPGVGLWDALSN